MAEVLLPGECHATRNDDRYVRAIIAWGDMAWWKTVMWRARYA